MRIACPYCGARDVREFNYVGDAAMAQRPQADGPDARERFIDYVYRRDNPSGPHRELWYHAAGCQAFVVVTRDTRSHQVLAVELASQAPAST
jgi:sarcosine oxidase subunit delta